jgi:hypothetical protein
LIAIGHFKPLVVRLDRERMNSAQAANRPEYFAYLGYSHVQLPRRD